MRCIYTQLNALFDKWGVYIFVTRVYVCISKETPHLTSHVSTQLSYTIVIYHVCWIIRAKGRGSDSFKRVTLLILQEGCFVSWTAVHKYFTIFAVKIQWLWCLTHKASQYQSNYILHSLSLYQYICCKYNILLDICKCILHVRIHTMRNKVELTARLMSTCPKCPLSILFTQSQKIAYITQGPMMKCTISA